MLIVMFYFVGFVWFGKYIMVFIKTKTKTEMGLWVRQEFFNLWMCGLPHVTHLDKNRGKMEDFKRGGILPLIVIHPSFLD